MTSLFVDHRVEEKPKEVNKYAHILDTLYLAATIVLGGFWFPNDPRLKKWLVNMERKKVDGSPRSARMK